MKERLHNKEEIKIKLDENIGKTIYEYLLNFKFDVSTAIEESLGGKSDEEIYEAVKKEGKILITLDRGFGNFLRYPLGKNFGIVVLRSDKDLNKKSIIKLIDKFIEAIKNNSPYGKLWIVSSKNIREHSAK